VDIPRTNDTRMPLESATYHRASAHGNVGPIKYMTHQLPPIKADSVIYVEFYPDNLTDVYVLLMSYNRMPTMKKYEFGVTLNGSSAEWADRGLYWESEGEYYQWNLDQTQVRNRTNGHWYLTVMQVSRGLTPEDMDRKERIPREQVKGLFAIAFLILAASELALLGRLQAADVDQRVLLFRRGQTRLGGRRPIGT